MSSYKEQVKDLCAKQGYTIEYKETLPSSKDDIYELEIDLCDRDGNNIPFKKIMIEDYDISSEKGWKEVLNIMMDSYKQSLCY